MSSVHARRRPIGPAAVLVIALTVSPLVVACGQSSTSSATGPSLGAKALHGLTPFEKKALKDKIVTVAELMASAQAYKECLTASHVDFDTSSADNLGPSGIQTVITVPPGTANPDSVADKLTAKAHACRDQVSAVEDVWVLQHQASQADIDKAKDNFVSCVRNAGLALSAGATYEDAADAAKRLLQGGRGNPATPSGREAVAVGDCLAGITQSAEVALPGLQQALASLNTAGW
jgi:hypothetical protein